MKKIIMIYTPRLGSYLGYVPFNSILFERMISYTGSQATVAFPMQVSDAVGYVGVMGIYLLKEFGPAFSYLEFFVIFGWAMCVMDAVLSIGAALYFLVLIRSRVMAGKSGDHGDSALQMSSDTLLVVETTAEEPRISEKPK